MTVIIGATFTVSLKIVCVRLKNDPARCSAFEASCSQLRVYCVELEEYGTADKVDLYN
jgi:hypothetical protein